MVEENAREKEKREEYMRRMDDVCDEIDRHNESVKNSRYQGLKDTLFDFNCWARPHVLHAMDGLAYKSTVYASSQRYRDNYDLIQWNRSN